jgi:uncharacterized membrane protein
MERRLEGIPPDLLAAVILALATLVLTLTPLNYLLGSIPLGLLVVLLFLPGYTLASALFPKSSDLGRVAKTALSFGLGIAVVPLISLALNYTPWGIRLIPIASSLALFTLFTAAVAYWRRLGIPAEERFSIQFNARKSSLKTETLADEKGRLAERTEKKLERRPLDLIAAVILALATLVFTLTPLNYLPVRIPLGLVMVLFVPGYTLIAALFPKRGDLEGIERIALSFGLSIAVVPLMGLALNYTPWGIRLVPVVISVVTFTIAMAAAAYWRRMSLPLEERFSIQLSEKWGSLKREILADDKGRLDKALTVILILTIIVSVAALIYVIVTPKQGEKFTEFYILGPGGKAYDYPTSVQADNKSTVIVGVVNHEYKLVNYTMQISLNNTPINDAWMNTSINSTPANGTLLNSTISNNNITNNSSSNNTLLNNSLLSNISLINTSKQDATTNRSSTKNASLENNSLLIYPIMSMNLTLQNNETWERPVTYTLNNTGDRQKLEFLLYKEGNFTEPYRDLHLWVNVTKTVSSPFGNATNLTAARG